jgi:hypothetical protein
MADRIFYVGTHSQNEDDENGKKKITGFVPAKFLTINGQPVVDPTPLGSQKAYIYSNDQGADRTDAANPNNYLIVPANFDEAQARAYAAQIAKIQNIPAIGTPLALAKMGLDFRPNGSQDLQRDPQWGIPEGSVAPAFVSSASHYLGLVTGLNGIPLEYAERGGGFTNRGEDKSGPHGVSLQNHENLVKGQSDAAAMRYPAWMTNNFSDGPQGQSPADQIGAGGGGRWISSLRGIDPMNPTQPAGPQKASGPLGVVSNEPMPDWPFPPPIFNPR